MLETEPSGNINRKRMEEVKAQDTVRKSYSNPTLKLKTDKFFTFSRCAYPRSQVRNLWVM